MDVFLLPLERWAKDLEAERESVYDYSRVGNSSPDRWAPDFTEAGTYISYIRLQMVTQSAYTAVHSSRIICMPVRICLCESVSVSASPAEGLLFAPLCGQMLYHTSMHIIHIRIVFSEHGRDM